MDLIMKGIKEGRGIPSLNKENANLAMNYGYDPFDCHSSEYIKTIRPQDITEQPTLDSQDMLPPKRKRKVILEAYVQTSYDQYAQVFETVEIELPDDNRDWHVVGEMQ